MKLGAADGFGMLSGTSAGHGIYELTPFGQARLEERTPSANSSMGEYLLGWFSIDSVVSSP